MAVLSSTEPRLRSRGCLSRARGGEARPFPFATLEALAGAESVVALARNLGFDHGQVYRWRATGLTIAQADELACATGFHPGSVWANWFSVEAPLWCSSCGSPTEAAELWCGGCGEAL